MDEAAAGVVREDYEEEKMRLIDAVALAREIEKIKWNLQMLDDTRSSDKVWNGVRMAEKKVESAPTIDAVPVVRCKDCKHWDEHSQYGYDSENGVYGNYCMLWTPDDDFYAVETPEDGFCYNGERKTNE